VTRPSPRPVGRGRGEDGSMLLISLVFVTVFAVLITAVITFTDVGLRASRGFGERGRTTYATDGAVQASIHRYASGGPCDDFDAPVRADGDPVGGRALTVHCSGPPPGGERANKPVNALLSLGTAAGEVGVETTAPMRVLGSVFSNSTVKAGGTLVVQGAVEATGNCTGPVQTDPPGGVRCANSPPDAGVADLSRGRDPRYVKARSTVPGRRSVPPCPAAPAWLVTLPPGYYDDAAALSALTSGACPNAVLWFQPGFHYFDFTFRGGAGTWTVNDPTVDVVGGAPRGWDPLAPARPAVEVPGSCRSDAGGGPPEGVQVVLGGGSHLLVQKGEVELCARPDPADQSIALYGMAPPPAGNAHTIEATAVPTVVGFTDPGNAVVIGETPVAAATADLAPGPGSVAQLVFKGFKPGVPAGALVEAVALRVSHHDAGDMEPLSAKVEFPGAPAGGCTPPALPLRPGAGTEDRVDLLAACNLGDPALFTDLSVTVEATLAAGGTQATETLDGIALEVVYREPTSRRPGAATAVTGFADAPRALEIGEQPAPLTADAALSAATPSAGLTVVGLGDPPLRAGTILDSVRLRVAHRDQGDLAPPTVTVAFPGSTCTGLVVPLSPTTVTDHRLDLKACGLDTPAELAAATAGYEVALAPSGVAGTASLDGIELEVVSRSPPDARPASTVTPTVFTDPDNAKVIGEVPTPLTADAALDAVTTTASLAFSGYDLPAIPPGSFVDSARLRIAHREDGDQGAPTLSVPFAGSTCPTPALGHRPGALGVDVVDLKACGLDDASLLNGLVVTYTATLDAGGAAATSRVDGVVLDLAYRPPTVRRAATAASTTFTNPDNAKAAGEQPTALTSDAALPGGAGTATLTLGDFGRVALPAGSAIDSARLVVTHQEDGPADVSVVGTFPGHTCTPTALPRRSGAPGVDRVDLKGCGLDDASELSALSVAYNATLGAGPVEKHVPTTTGAVSGFTAADDARAVDGAPALAELAAGGPGSASLTLSGYDTPAAPAGANVASAVLRIAHQDDGQTGPVTATVSFPGSTCTPRTIPARPGAMAVDTVDVAACGLTDPAQLAGMSVTYTAELAPGGDLATFRLDGVELDVAFSSPATAKVDGIELELVYRPPAFTPLSGCVTQGPYPTTGCALVKVAPTAPDHAVRFAVAGTVYAPTAALDIAMAAVESQVFTRGLIGRVLRLGIAAHPGNRRPVTGIPPEAVVFTVYPNGNIGGSAASTTFADPQAAEQVDGTEAEATIDTANPVPTELTVNAFTTPLAPDASIGAAVLRVKHREEPAIGSVIVTVSLNGTPCPSHPVTLPTHTGVASVEDQVDLEACGLVTANQVGGLSVAYRVELDLTATPMPQTVRAWVDAITLDVLSGPALRARVVFDRGTATVNGWTTLP
jgi:hypothetical protein